jgi:hypothetical protein
MFAKSSHRLPRLTTWGRSRKQRGDRVETVLSLNYDGMSAKTSTCSPTWSKNTRTSTTRSNRSLQDALLHLVESSGKTRATIAAEAGLPESSCRRSCRAGVG